MPEDTFATKPLPDESNDAAALQRQLLWALLGVQNDLIDRKKLPPVLAEWKSDKTRLLVKLLVDRGAIQPDGCALLDALVKKHLELHGDDPQQSIGALSSLGSLRAELEQLADDDIYRTIAQVPHGDGPSSSSAASASNIGRSSASRFRIVKPHARGGLGEVFVAQDIELDRDVALKEIQARHADDPESRSRFLREAAITGKLEHPGIVPVYGLGTYADGRPYYAMRFIQGDSLKEAIDRFHNPVSRVARDARQKDAAAERSLEFRKLLQRFVDVCNAIEYAHSKGVLHRDLKPGNIMLGQYGETLVVDWGLAKVMNHGAGKTGEPKASAPGVPQSETAHADPHATAQHTPATDGATMYGQALGTPQYMSPEQAAGKLDELGPRSDVYSLGATLYTLLTGKAPFSGKTINELLENVRQGKFPAPRSVHPETPRALEAICLKAMSLKSAERYATPRALADDIEHCLADEQVTAYQESFTERAARWARTHRTAVTGASALTATAIVSLAIGLFVVSAEQRETERQRQTAETKQHEAEAAQAKEAEQRLVAEARKKEAEEAQAQEVAERKRANAERDAAEWSAYLANIQAADAEWDRNHVSIAHTRLDACAPHLRNWEHQYLVAKFRRGHTTIHTDESTMDSVAFSHDGVWVVSGGYQTLKVWDIATLKEIASIDVRKHPRVEAVAFSPDRKKLIFGSHSTVKLWDFASGSESVLFEGESIVDTAVFSPDGLRMLVSAGAIRLFDALDSREIWTLADASTVTCAAFSPDARRIMTGDTRGVLKIWNSDTGKEIQTLQRESSYIHALSLSPDGTAVATADDDGTITVWDVESNRIRHLLRGHFGAIQSIDFSSDGNRIVSGGNDTTVRIWDAVTGLEMSNLRGHEGGVPGVAFSPDGKQVISASSDGTVRIWDVAYDHQIPTLHARIVRGPSAVVLSAAFSPDGKRLATGSYGSVQVWDVESRTESLFINGHSYPVWSVVFSPDGKQIASASGDKTIKLWNAENGQLISTLRGHTGFVLCVAYSADGLKLASAGADKTVRVWNASDGKELHLLQGHGSPVFSAGFTPDGHGIVSRGKDMLKLWDASTGTEVATTRIKHDQSSHGMPIIRDAVTGVNIQYYKGVPLQAISRDGRRIAGGDANGVVHFWDAATGHETLTLRKHTLLIRCVVFSPDGTKLASCSEDETTTIWDATPSPESLQN